MANRNSHHADSRMLLDCCRTTPFAAKNYLSTYKKIAAYSKHGKLKWKPEMTEEARELIQGMLHPKPAQRLGNTSGGIDELKGHRWFESLDWDKLYKREVRYSVRVQAPPLTIFIPVRCCYEQLNPRSATTDY